MSVLISVDIYVCAHVCGWFWRPEEDIQSTGAEGMGTFKIASCVFSEQSSSPLQE